MEIIVFCDVDMFTQATGCIVGIMFGGNSDLKKTKPLQNVNS